MRSALVDNVLGSAWGAEAPPPGSWGLESLIRSDGLEQFPTAERDSEPRLVTDGMGGDEERGGGLADSQFLASVLRNHHPHISIRKKNTLVF